MRPNPAKILGLLLSLSACRQNPMMQLEVSPAGCVAQPLSALEVFYVEGDTLTRFDDLGPRPPHRFSLEVLPSAPASATLRIRYLGPTQMPLAAGVVKVPLSQPGCFAVSLPLGADPEALIELGPCSMAPAPCAPDAGPTTEMDAGGAPDLGPGPDMGPACPEPLPDGAQRLPLIITAGEDPAPLGYPLSLSLDHQALVAEGLSRSDGADIQILGPSGQALHRVPDPDPARGFGTSQTLLRFRLQAPLGAGERAMDYALVYGPRPAQEVLQDPLEVYTNFIDPDRAESGDLYGSQVTCNGCTLIPAAPPGGAHSGTSSLLLRIPAGESGDIKISPDFVDAQEGYYTSVCFRVDSFEPDGGLILTERAISVLRYESTAPSWSLSMDMGVGWIYGLSLGASSPEFIGLIPEDSWVRVELFAHPARGAIRVLLDGQPAVVTAPSPEAGGLISDVHLGLLESVASGAELYIDDLLIAPWVPSEPTVSLACPPR